jgi:cysteine-rich repeat protein
MLLSWEVQWSGFRRLLMLRPSLDTLVFFQCAAAMTHGVWSVLLPDFAGGNGFYVLACISCFFALRQKRNRMITVRRGVKTAMVGAMPAGVKICRDYVGNRVAVKCHEGAEPDFRVMARPDRTEEASFWFAPLLISMIVIFAVMIGYTNRLWMLLPWYFAALSAVAVPGGLILASAPAARKIGKQLFASGCMLVNSQCAKIMSKTGFAILCDRDIYPVGTMKITGMKVVAPFDRDVSAVVRYTAGVMIFLGGGIGKAFSDFAREQDKDGCTDACQVKNGWYFNQAQALVEIECGNGTLDPGEQCDDGDTDDDNGCSRTCRVEEGWICPPTGPCFLKNSCGNGIVNIMSNATMEIQQQQMDVMSVSSKTGGI